MAAAADAALRDKALRRIPEMLWMSMIFRALPVLAGALVITFSQHQSARFGFAVFGAVVLWSGIIVGFEAIGIKGHPARPLVFTRSLLTAIAGGFSLFMATGGHTWATAGSFILTVAIWGVVTGIVELFAALQTRKQNHIYSSEILFSGALTLLLGVIVALVPPDLRIEYGGFDNAHGALTADLQAIGFVGGYFAILGVLLVIEALSLRASVRRAQEQDEIEVQEGTVA